MTKLMINQYQILNPEENNLINIFYNKTAKPKTILKKERTQFQNEDFIENLVLLKTSGNNLVLFNRLIKIHENTSIEMACKYLHGFLEDYGVKSVEEFIQKSN